MAIFGSFGHCLPNILHTCPHDSFQLLVICQWPWAYFKVNGLFHIKFLKNGVWYGKSYYRQLIGNHTLAFDWCHFWWPWSTFEGHFSLGCHFHVHFSYPSAFTSHGLPAIAELLVVEAYVNHWWHQLLVKSALEKKLGKSVWALQWEIAWCYNVHLLKLTGLNVICVLFDIAVSKSSSEGICLLVV